MVLPTARASEGPSSPYREEADDSRVAQRKVVKVWFGTHEIATYVAVPELADRYAAAMRRRFAGLRVTNEPVAESPQARELPGEALWPLTAL